jgi:hypothetical protein
MPLGCLLAILVKAGDLFLIVACCRGRAIPASLYGADGVKPEVGERMSEPDRTSLPIRRPSSRAVANRTLAGSEPDWNLIGHVQPPMGAPNVLLVLIDDAGFGNPGTFGGPIATPNYTRIAEGGLKYNRFHVTALCSPTRGAAADRP